MRSLGNQLSRLNGQMVCIIYYDCRLPLPACFPMIIHPMILLIGIAMQPYFKGTHLLADVLLELLSDDS